MSDFYSITVNSNRTRVFGHENLSSPDPFLALEAYNAAVEAHARDRDVRIAHQDQQGTELWETVFANGDVILMHHVTH